MATLGLNLKLTIDGAERARTRALFTEVLGCTMKSPRPDFEVYDLADGCHVGCFYVDQREALPPADQKKGPWLEFLVADVAATTAALARLGIEPFPYTDASHPYFSPPGGPVFRLAAK